MKWDQFALYVQKRCRQVIQIEMLRNYLWYPCEYAQKDVDTCFFILATKRSGS